MKYGDLIKAAVDGTQIQWLHSSGEWKNFASPSIAITYLAGVVGYECRIAPPPPPPDVIKYHVVAYATGQGHCYPMQQLYVDPKMGFQVKYTYDGDTKLIKSVELL